MHACLLSWPLCLLAARWLVLLSICFFPLFAWFLALHRCLLLSSSYVLPPSSSILLLPSSFLLLLPASSCFCLRFLLPSLMRGWLAVLRVAAHTIIKKKKRIALARGCSPRQQWGCSKVWSFLVVGGHYNPPGSGMCRTPVGDRFFLGRVDTSWVGHTKIGRLDFLVGGIMSPWCWGKVSFLRAKVGAPLNP